MPRSTKTKDAAKQQLTTKMETDIQENLPALLDATVARVKAEIVPDEELPEFREDEVAAYIEARESLKGYTDYVVDAMHRFYGVWAADLWKCERVCYNCVPEEGQSRTYTGGNGCVRCGEKVKIGLQYNSFEDYCDRVLQIRGSRYRDLLSKSRELYELTPAFTAKELPPPTERQTAVLIGNMRAVERALSMDPKLRENLLKAKVAGVPDARRFVPSQFARQVATDIWDEAVQMSRSPGQPIRNVTVPGKTLVNARDKVLRRFKLFKSDEPHTLITERRRPAEGAPGSPPPMDKRNIEKKPIPEALSEFLKAVDQAEAIRDELRKKHKSAKTVDQIVEIWQELMGKDVSIRTRTTNLTIRVRDAADVLLVSTGDVKLPPAPEPGEAPAPTPTQREEQREQLQ